MPQIDNERRGLNTKRGMRQAMREGRTMGRPPLGYLNDKFNKTIIIDEINASLIKEGFEQLSKGVYTIEEVRKLLIKKGLKNCCKQSFLNHVRNPYYYGLIVMSAWKDEPEEEFLGQHIPLISKELFDDVQNVLFGKRKNTQVKLTRKEELPLRGYLFCNSCGGKLTGSRSTSRNGTKHFYYHCQKGCKERFRADIANNAFEDYLASLEIDESLLDAYKLTLEDIFNQDESERRTQINQTEDKIHQINSKLISLEDKYLADALTLEEYHSMKFRIQGELNEWKYKRQELNTDISAFKQYFNYGLPFLLNMKTYYNKSDLEIKQKIIGSIFPGEIIFSENKYRTTKTNEFLSLMTLNINKLDKKRNGQTNNKIDLPILAPSLGLEPRTL